MLRIGSIRWKGKCAKHPLYNPAEAGEAAIKGGCQRCQSLLDLYKHHARLVQMMRAFGPQSDRPKRPTRKKADSVQPSLFDLQELS